MLASHPRSSRVPKWVHYYSRLDCHYKSTFLQSFKCVFCLHRCLICVCFFCVEMFFPMAEMLSWSLELLTLLGLKNLTDSRRFCWHIKRPVNDMIPPLGADSKRKIQRPNCFSSWQNGFKIRTRNGRFGLKH